MIKHGDIFKLGNHKIACGDATDQILVDILLSGIHISLIATDPPYGVAYAETKKGQEHHKPIIGDGLQSDEAYASFTTSWMSTIVPYLARKNSAYVFNSDKMVFALRQGMLQAGFKVGQLLIWIKSAPVLGRLDYHPQHELILYGWSGVHAIRKRNDRSVLFESKQHKNGPHPTMKPTPLLRRLILNSSNVGEIVYDPFLGSGTTLLAAEQTERVCYGIELDPEYVQLIIDRWEKLTGNKAEKIG